MNTKEYQDIIFSSLKEIFEEGDVKREWDSVKYDPHLSNHKQIYAPRAWNQRGARITEGMRASVCTRRNA